MFRKQAHGWFLAVMFAVLSFSASIATPLPDALRDPAAEARARGLQREFRCLVCQGQSLDESEAPLATDLRRLIRQRIAAGDTNAQIERYLVARYGDFILMQPPLEPATYALWIAPVLLLIGGAAIALTAVLRAEKRAHGDDA